MKRPRDRLVASSIVLGMAWSSALAEPTTHGGAERARSLPAGMEPRRDEARATSRLLVEELAHPAQANREKAARQLIRRLDFGSTDSMARAALAALREGTRAAIDKSDLNWKHRIDDVLKVTRLQLADPCGAATRKLRALPNFARSVGITAAVARALSFEEPVLRAPYEGLVTRLWADDAFKSTPEQRATFTVGYRNSVRKALEKHGLIVKEVKPPTRLYSTENYADFDIPVVIVSGTALIEVSFSYDTYQPKGAFDILGRVDTSNARLSARDIFSPGQRLANEFLDPSASVPLSAMLQHRGGPEEKLALRPFFGKEDHPYAVLLDKLLSKQRHLKRQLMQSPACSDKWERIPFPPRTGKSDR